MISHGTSRKYKEGCRCDLCTANKRREYALSYKPRKRTNGRTPASEKYDFTRAEQLLEDGASYRETAITVGIPKSTLVDNVPGYGWSPTQSGEFRTLLNRHKRLTPELWGMNRHNNG